MSRDTGGPAFPSSMTDDTLHVPGMTLRDYFAAKAMQGMVHTDYRHRITTTVWAKCAYEVADAMLAAAKEQP